MLSREKIYSFIDTTPNESSYTWKLFGERVESMAKDYNANELTFHPITRANPIVTTTAFAKSASITQIADQDDPTFAFIESLYWKEAKGDSAKTTILEVAPHRVVEGEGENPDAYEAKISEILISQQNEGGDGGDNYQFSYNIHWVSDPTYGTVTLTGGVPTFVEDNGE